MGASRRTLLSLCLVAVSSTAAAQTPDEVPDTRIGHAADALPGYGRVALPRPGAWLAAVSASAGYGFTESVLQMDDSHNRISGRVAVSLQPIDWLSFAIRVDGRYDTHSVAGVSDDGLVGDPRLTVRAGGDLGGFFLGGQATLWVPGADAPDIDFSATTLDLLAPRGSRRYPRPDVRAQRGGTHRQQRRDRREQRSGPEPRRSDVARREPERRDPLGIGGAYRFDPAEIFAELTWDMIVGDGAPDVTQSPMRVGLGGRLWLGDTDMVQLELGIEVATSGRPAPNALGYLPLMPIEPRFSAHLGATFRFPEPDFPTAVVEDGGGGGNDTGEEEEGAVTVRGRILDEAGQPVEGAEVVVTPGEGDALPAVASGSDGSFEVANVSRAPGGHITIHAEGYVETTQPLEIGEGDVVTPRVALSRDLPSGQLRGVVQSFTGETVSATVRVEPLGQEVTVAEDGSFELDVPPGDYEVVITAPGYHDQRRPVTVEQQGVTILNVDLRRH